MDRLVVIGGDAAGMSAASQARKRRGPDDLQIVAFERGRATSYSACGIPYWISGDVEREEQLVSRSPEQHRRNRHRRPHPHRGRRRSTSTARHGARPRPRRAAASTPSRSTTSSTPRAACPTRPPVPGIDAAGVYGVQTLDDGAALRAALDRRGAPGRDRRRRLHRPGDRRGLPGARPGRDRRRPLRHAGPHVRPRHRRRSSRTPCAGWASSWCSADGVTEIATDADGRATAVHTASGRQLPADLVVLGLGVRPNVALAREAGHPARARPAGSPSTTACAPRSTGVWAGGRLRRVVHRLSGQRGRGRARHPRQQAGPGRRHQHRRRLRHVPGRDRHRDHQGLRRRGGPHRAVGGRGRGGRLPLRHRRGRLHDQGRLLPRRRSPSGSSWSPSGAPAGCSARRSSAGRTRPSASTRWPSRSGTR